MQKVILLIAVTLLWPLPAKAQDNYPSAEIFGGYSYLNTKFFDRENLHGWGLSITGNLSRRVGIAAELSGHYGKGTVPGSSFIPTLDEDLSIHTFLFGPRLFARGDKITAFGHVLAGGARRKFESAPSDTSFAMAVGGGADIKASKRVAIRILQVDYLPVRAGRPQAGLESNRWEHNFRMQTGIVFCFRGD